MMAGITQWQRGDDAFRDKIVGPLYNKLPVHRSPHLLVAPRDEHEVVRAIRAAREAGHKVAVRSGGHSWIGASVRDRGMLIDMGAFDRVVIDAAARKAHVGAAVRNDHFGRLLAKEGLAFPIGHCGGPAMGGYLLTGGLGLNWGLWQPACFSVRSIRAVTAAGELVVANENSNSELLWMARGAGPGFPGVITEFELELKDRPADVRVSSWYFPLDAVDEVTHWVRDASVGLPANVELAVTTIGPDRPMLPPGSGSPTHLVGVSALAFVDSEAEARKALASLSAGPGVRALMQSDLEPIPFEALHLGADATHPEGQRVLGDTFWTDRNVHEVLPPLSTLVTSAPAGKSFIVAIMPGHGASSSGVPKGAGAYSMDERTLVLAYAIWDDAAADAPNQTWMSEMVRPLEMASTGHFLGEADLTRHPERAARSFSKANWERLSALRVKWDPEGVFHGYPEATV
jgi:FAD/FMN-containing dehydrogenase